MSEIVRRILVINGPNINLTGQRETKLYGKEPLDEINDELFAYASKLPLECAFFQSNSEGEIIDEIHSVIDSYDGCIINAGAYSHYSYAIRDAIAAVGKPFIEVHMTNIAAREEFRHTSVIAPVCAGQISGFGKLGYKLAMRAMWAMQN